MPVFSPGTKAMIAVPKDDSIRAIAHRWRYASITDQKLAPLPPTEIAKSIVAQLDTIPESADVKVDRVTVSYYDGGKEFLQPVYRFTATVVFRNRKLRGTNRHLSGFVSIGEAVEPLPTLGQKQGKLPAEPSKYRTTKEEPNSRNDP